MKPRLHIVTVSTRPGRVGPAVAAWALQAAEAHGGFDCRPVDLADFALPLYDEAHHPRLGRYEKPHTLRWAESVRAADAYVFVTPEYNFAAPPSLVNALDFLYAEWACKPAAFVSYGGQSGGLRAVQSVKAQMTTLRLMPLPDGVPVPFVRRHLGADGTFTPPEEIAAQAAPMLDDLLRWAMALRGLRT